MTCTWRDDCIVFLAAVFAAGTSACGGANNASGLFASGDAGGKGASPGSTMDVGIDDGGAGAADGGSLRGGHPSGGAGADGGGDDAGTIAHSLGVITIGEAHESGASTSAPSVAASFFPDAALATICTTVLDGCTLAAQPICDGNVGPLCGSSQICALDDTCSSVCEVPCTAQCATGEECYFSTPSTQACRTVQAFNAGALAFAGTTTPLTLYPPYAYSAGGQGSLFLAGASLEVQASGVAASAGAGFEPFDEKFVATSFVQTAPSLSTLEPTVVWGTGAVPVGWTPGSDSVVVSVTGAAGTAQCQATDATGRFDVPRAVIDAVIGATQSVTMSVTRQRLTVDTAGKAQGTLSWATVQPIGYVEVGTTLTESYSFQGCGDVGQTACDDGCDDLQTNAADCGACGHACSGADTCQAGACVGTAPPPSCGSLTSCPDGCQNLQTSDTDCGSCAHACPSSDSCVSGACVPPPSDTCDGCQSSANTGACAAAYSTCASDSQCISLVSCFATCALGDMTCELSCLLQYPDASSDDADALQTCYCETACATLCGSAAFCKNPAP